MEETRQNYVIEAKVPGYSKESLDLAISHDRMITISGRLDAHQKDKWNQESFYESIMLPSNVDTSNISCQLKNGLLRIQIPKSSDDTIESSKPIEIQE
jgi:HSP20 family molecular chaperone IbpA